MSTSCCPVCAGPTFELRAKLICRQCGAILETCCEGGPMAFGCPPASTIAAAGPATESTRPELSNDSQVG